MLLYLCFFRPTRPGMQSGDPIFVSYAGPLPIACRCAFMVICHHLQFACNSTVILTQIVRMITHLRCDFHLRRVLINLCPATGPPSRCFKFFITASAESARRLAGSFCFTTSAAMGNQAGFMCFAFFGSDHQKHSSCQKN